MKFSYNWIKSYFAEDIPKPEELTGLLTTHAFEVEDIEEKENDWLLNIDVLPNRAHDCFSHAGIAREVSAITGAKIKQLFPARHASAGVAGRHPRDFEVSKKVKTRVADPEATPRISALSIENITVGESPEWIKGFLQAIGQKPINNIVDATNLVMLHSGQPLHAYDRDKLTEKDGVYVLSARRVTGSEGLATLDGQTRNIPEGAFVITDDNRDAPLSIAGIKGGAESRIEPTTENIVVEAANFNPTLIRQTSRALKLRTDASDRFEKEISPELTRVGLEEFAALILEMCPDAVIEGLADDYPNPQKITGIELPKDFATKKLGVEIAEARIKEVLESLDMKLEDRGDSWLVTVPPQRLDVTWKEDLVEEIGRIIGYDNVPLTPLGNTSFEPEMNKTEYYCNKIREELINDGYSEVMTYSFVPNGEVELENPLASDKNFLRASLLPKLKEVYELNKKNKDLLGLKEVKIFEIGKVFKDGKEMLVLGKMPEGTEENLDDYISAQPEPKETLHFELSTLNSKFNKISPYPFITRDVALWVPADTKPEDLMQLIRDNAGNLLVKLFMFDRFEKGERVSYAFRLVFQSMDRTLTDEEVTKAFNPVLQALQQNSSFEIR